MRNSRTRLRPILAGVALFGGAASASYAVPTLAAFTGTPAVA